MREKENFLKIKNQGRLKQMWGSYSYFNKSFHIFFHVLKENLKKKIIGNVELTE